MAYEMRAGEMIISLDGRVVEVLTLNSSYQHRVHVDAVGFGVKGPDRHGEYKAMIGTLDGDEMHLGITRTSFKLDEAGYRRFEAFVALAKAARDAGPDPW